MSETAYERGYRVASEHAAGGSPSPGSSPSSARASTGGRTILFRQMGTLPLWAWMVLGLVVILGYSYWKNRKSSTSVSSGTTSTSDIPQFVNQVYTNPSPPSDTDEGGHEWKPSPVPPIRTPTPVPKGGKPIDVASFKYTVKKGDTLLSLSQKFLGTANRTALAHANGLGTGSSLRAGQVITIPAHKSPPGAIAPPGGVKSGGGGTSGGSGGGEGED